MMELATQTHLAKLRDMLGYRLNELRADIHAADLAAADAVVDSPSVDDVRDTKDAAMQLSSLDLLATQRQRDADELALVEAALARLDAGSYGDCADCGEPIALARLWVQPAATRCAACQAKSEKARRAP